MNNFQTGLVSVTFRQKSISKILSMCRENNLDAIEIGSDVHAPRDDIANCEAIRAAAEKEGVRVISYGTYYKLGEQPDPEKTFKEYVRAAKALGAPNLRVWAGTKGSGSVSETERATLTREASLCADIAKESGMAISFEFHGGTLTDDPDSALRLMRELDRENAHLYWQPNQYRDIEFNVMSLKKVLNYVSTIHVFAWDARSGNCIRYPLADHADVWKRYLDILASDNREHALLLEFVKDDSDAYFAADAATLNEWSKRYAF